MILAICSLSFLTVFFMSLFASNVTRPYDNRMYGKILDRLQRIEKAEGSTPLEKKDRLSDMPFFDLWLRKISGVKKMQAFLTQAGLTFSLGSFILFTLLIGALSFFIGILTQNNITLAFLMSFVCASVPAIYVSFKRGTRRKKFSARFPDAIGMLASSLRSGYSIQMALRTVIEEEGDVVAQEFAQVLTELEVGKSFEEALKNILNRVDTAELRLFISAVILQRETGGNLAELLDHLEATIRERQQLNRELKATTSQARFSGIVLGLLPVFVSFFVFLVHPDYILFFFREAIGTKLLIACFIGQGLGILTIRKIVNIDL